MFGSCLLRCSQLRFAQHRCSAECVVVFACFWACHSCTASDRLRLRSTCGSCCGLLISHREQRSCAAELAASAAGTLARGGCSACVGWLPYQPLLSSMSGVLQRKGCLA